MTDLPNPSLIDTPYSPEPVEVPSWGMIGVVFFVFVVTGIVFVADEGRPFGQPAGAPSGLSPQAVSGEAAHQAQGRVS